VNLSDLHLLQRLVYVESELFERLIEGQRNTVQQDDLIIRYIKHLVRITTKHNSFYVTLGLCRLLYSYSTRDTAEIYNSVLQDPERIRDDYYYRSRKKRLMEEIKERFGNLVRTQRVLRGEERFQPQEDSQKYARLVKECLIRFTPWHSSCVLPSELDPNRNVITPFLFEGGDPDQEHEVELNRIHTLIHPECLARLTAALGLAAADERLELPAFFVSSEGSRPAEDRFNPTELTEGELEAIRRQLDKSATHRRQLSQEQLSLLIDGKRESVFELKPSRSCEFDLRAAAELIEIRSVGLDGDYQETSLAVCLLKHDQSGILPLDSSASLGKGSRLVIKVLPLTDDSGEGCGAKLTVDYQLPAPTGAVFSLLRHIGSWRHDLIDFRARASLRMLKPALGLVFIALCASGLWFYFHSRPAANPSQVAQLHEDRRGVIPFIAPPQFQKESELPRKKTLPTTGTASNIAQPSNADSAQERGSDQTRGTNAIATPALLLEVKRAYVDSLGEDSFSRELRENLMAALQGSHRFEVVGNRDEADAVFKGSVRQILNQGSSLSIVLELVNVRGQVIWSLTSQKHGTILSSNAADASAAISKVLLHDIRTLERKH
jgi:hypothetical protein